MSQVLSFPVDTDPQVALPAFLDSWREYGDCKRLDENCYELRSQSGNLAVLTVDRTEVILEGRFPEHAHELMNRFSAACGSKLYLEGVPMDHVEDPRSWTELSIAQRAGVTILFLLLLPLIILSLPILLLVVIARVFWATRR